MSHRFRREGEPGHDAGILTDEIGRFNGEIIIHPERLTIPIKRQKPTVYAIWNDWCHENVPFSHQHDILKTARNCQLHTFLLLTKRASNLKKVYEEESKWSWPFWNLPNVCYGLTVCNQQEADEKIPVFLQVPGKKFISHEPALERIDYGDGLKDIAVLISGGETGPGARPSHPDIFRADRDQCQAADVPFFFKGWGKWGLNWEIIPGSEWMDKTIKQPGRLLDGRTHDDLPWDGERSGR